MKITKITITDFLGLSAFKVDNLGKFNQIKGGNGVGKSTVLKAIEETFKSSGVSPHIIKNDAERAEILIELDEKVLVHRKITQSTNTVAVTVEGAKLEKPQAYLTALIGEFNFNPVDFLLKKDKERREILLSAIPFKLSPDRLRDSLQSGDALVDLSQFNYDKHGLEVIETIRKDVFERRHQQNVEATRMKKAIEQDKLDLPQIADAKAFEGFDLTAELNKLQAANDEIATNREETERLSNLRERRDTLVTNIDSLKKQLEKAENELTAITAEGTELAAKIAEYESPDTAAIQNRISEFNRNQKSIHALEDLRKREAECEGLFAKHKKLDALYKHIENELPKLLLSEIKLPVKGLEISGDEILVNGVSIDTLSTSEQVEFSVNLARILAGKLKVICVDRFESLDAEKRRCFEQSIDGDEFEYFVTQVTEGPLTVDTEVKTAPKRAAKATF